MTDMFANATPNFSFEIFPPKGAGKLSSIFETVDEITRFYIAGVNFINQTLNEGWARKDSIDWSPYEPDKPEPETQS